MKLIYDPIKNEINISARGLSFDLAEWFEFETALIWEDTRKDYQETRFIALGYIADRLHSLVFTYREEALRVISLRKANKREVKSYETNIDN